MPFTFLAIPAAVALLVIGLSLYYFWVEPMLMEKISKKILPLYEKGDKADAIRVAEKAMNAAERAYGYPGAGFPLNRLIFLHLETGNFSEAEPLLRKALSYEHAPPEKSYPDITVLWNHLGLIAAIFGRMPRAEDYFKKSLDTRKKILGEIHALTIISLENLAGLYVMAGRSEEAEAHLRKAMISKQKLFGPESPEVADSLKELAKLAAARKNLEGASVLAGEALEIERKIAGGRVADQARSLLSRAKTSAEQGKENEAKALENQARKMLNREIKRIEPGWIAGFSQSIRDALQGAMTRVTTKPIPDPSTFYRVCKERQGINPAEKEARKCEGEPKLGDTLSDLCIATYLTGRFARFNEKYERYPIDFETEFWAFLNLLLNGETEPSKALEKWGDEAGIKS